jgi:hypothetical protein
MRSSLGLNDNLNGNSASTLEASIEKFLVDEVERRGGKCEKVRVIGSRGFFDRLVALPKGFTAMVELKKPKGGRLSPHQRERIRTYVRLGARVRICKTRDDVLSLMDEYDEQA